MTAELIVRAFGEPIPQGSKSAAIRGGRAVMFDANPRLMEWRRIVTDATVSAMLASSWTALSGPVAVEIELRVPRPRSVPKSRIRPHLRGLDLDKGIRAILDSITVAGAWGDDAQVCTITASKSYADERRPGATIRVAAMTEQAALL